jgi:hypothetical protein
MTLPPITNQQQAILKLLYRYRFLDRKQIQSLLGHNDKKRSIVWLKDLRDKQYVTWLYDGQNLAEKIKPAVYYLNLNGIRFLRSLDVYPPDGLRKRYKESTRQPDFRARCGLIADCCLNLETQRLASPGLDYAAVVRSDYDDPGSGYHFLRELGPGLCFVKDVALPAAVVTTNYLLEIFDNTTPRYIVKQRLKAYVAFLSEGDWELATGDAEPPVVLIACPTTAELIYAKRRTRQLLEDTSEDEAIHIRFATVEKIKQFGVTGIIWEEV